jgi:D-aminoacyl-tRNA deacylase
MACLIYSVDQVTSTNIADALKRIMGFEEADPVEGMKSFRSGGTLMIEARGSIVETGFVDRCASKDVAVLLSMHSSARGVEVFTVHPEGNWGDDANLGGKPKMLSTASPANMLSMLKAISKKSGGLQATYEATHHGPLLDTPSFFVEVGGSERAVNSKELAGVLAGAIADFLGGGKAEYGKVAIGIGGTHYPGKFTRLALEGRYAFAHMMPKYSIHGDMLRQAIERSDVQVEKAVIEWKSLNAGQRNEIVQKLEETGIDYEKV